MHFGTLAHPYSAELVAKVLFTEIMLLYDVPVYIISDIDPVFTSASWQKLFHVLGSNFHMSGQALCQPAAHIEDEFIMFFHGPSHGHDLYDAIRLVTTKQLRERGV
ncbi:hypothetical protein E2562_000153 [Oryza meyeriana var. granulata]|uniref:Integrase catalytic domain-containing protein n=1 Tax=Oryza meyeriana var. granulata TaxID=110450 RepID=A0A6G1DBU2_9ORYZ|nr:hypothetical protein E2562_000153 [Oryza meyeriana var. granulata]